MKKIKLDLRFLYLFIPLFLLEVIFRFVQIPTFDIFVLIRVLLFHLFLSLFISFIFTRFKTNKVYFVISSILVPWFCIYTFVELIFKNCMGDFYSFGTVSDGATRIAQFALTFLSNAKPKYYLCLIPIIVYILLRIFVKFKETKQYQLPCISTIICFLALCLTMDLGSTTTSILHTYATFSNKDILIDKLGITHFFFRDISALVYKAPEEIIIVEEVDEGPQEVKEKTRQIDDTRWKNIMENETNSNMLTIDKYLSSKSVTQPNDMTGVFNGMNFIYFLVESGDYLMIDKDLTPNLYKLYSEGIDFENHYTPLYSCGTGESEYVSYNSVFPYVNTCTPNYMTDTPFYNALPWLFKKEGYDSFGIHNWRDEWYERNDILNAMGIDTYYDIDDIWQDPSIEHTNGWQSDSMLIEQAYKHIEEFDDKYFAMIISSTMHFPYDESSYWGDKYVDEVRQIHPDWDIDYCRYMSKSMDFDDGIGYLLDKLKEDGTLDNTVICMYCDHRPYWLDYDKVIEYTSWLNDRSEYKEFGDSGDERVGIYRAPFIIYNSKFEHIVNSNYCSTMDHVPTIANLFDLDYDPRLYIGKDAFSGNNTVIFTNNDWVNEKGIYDSSKGLFIPKSGTEMPDETYIQSIVNQVQNQINISYLILDESYFEKRKEICSPDVIRNYEIGTNYASNENIDEIDNNKETNIDNQNDASYNYEQEALARR